MALTSRTDMVDVVIVGAGPAGLALAIELGSRGIACHLVERRERTGHAPRAKLTNVRSAELLRRWGLQDAFEAAAPFGADYPSNILFVTRLGGPQIARIENAFACKPGQDSRYSAHAQWVPQYALEDVMMRHVSTLPSVTVTFGEELHAFAQHDNGIDATIRTLGARAERIARARYLVGADGAHSTMRQQMGVTMEGQGALSRNYNIIFEAPGLAEAHDHGPGVIIWQLNRDVPSVIGPMDSGDRWYFMPTGIADGVTYTKQEAADVIRRATGIDLPYRVLSSDEWIASGLLADRYSTGRAFLIGDACHLHPPYGGHGMNMGIADGLDLGWKLAAVLQGWAAPSLLDTYEGERRRVHERVIEEALSHHEMSPNQLVPEGIEDPGPQGQAVREQLGGMILSKKQPQFHSLGVTLGYCYRGSPIVFDEDGAMWEPTHEYRPRAMPGCLAPHTWLSDGRSLYDRFGPGFSLLVLAAGQEGAVAEAVMQAAVLSVPLTIVDLPDAGLDCLYEAPLALIRPDQHLAWRGGAPPADLFERVTARAMQLMVDHGRQPVTSL